MAKKKSIDELAEEIIRDFDAGDTPEHRAQTALQQARDAGDGAIRQQHVQEALRHLAHIDPRQNPKLMQRLHAEVLALQGRRGDTRIAHLTPGEVVIPRRLQTPGLMRALEALARHQGIEPASLHVGSGRNAVNPHTGQMEFAEPDVTRQPLYDPETGISCPVLDPIVRGNFGEDRPSGPHNGVDLRNRIGQPVFATEDGIAKVQPNGPGGNQMFLQDTPSGLLPGYAHTRSIVKDGERLQSGQLIGYSDGSGTRDPKDPTKPAPHLHFTARPGPEADRIDPISYYIGKACGMIK